MIKQAVNDVTSRLICVTVKIDNNTVENHRPSHLKLWI